MARSSWKKTVAAVGRYVASWAWLEPASDPLVAGDGEVVAEGQRILLCTQKGHLLTDATVLTYRRVAIVAGTRTSDGAAVDLLGDNPKRVGFEIYAKSGTSFLGSDDQVDVATGRPLLPTNNREQYGPGIYTGALFAADDGEHDCDLSVWEWSNP